MRAKRVRLTRHQFRGRREEDERDEDESGEQREEVEEEEIVQEVARFQDVAVERFQVPMAAEKAQDHDLWPEILKT